MAPHPPKYIKVGEKAFAAGAESTSDIVIRIPDLDDNGEHLHVEELVVELDATITYDKNSNDVIVKPDRLVSRIHLEKSGLPTLINKCSLDELVKMFRLENGGRYPEHSYTGSPADGVIFEGYKHNAVALTPETVHMAVAVQLRRPGIAEQDDELIPAKVYNEAAVQVLFGAITDVLLDDGDANCTIASITNGKLTVWAKVQPRSAYNVGPIPVIEWVQLTRTVEEPTRTDGAIVSACIERPDGDIVNTDMTTIGLSVDNFVALPTTMPARTITDGFNRTAADPAFRLPLHTVAPTITNTGRARLIPLVYPGRTAQRVTKEAIDARRQLRLDFDALSVSYRLLRRRRVSNPSYMAEVKRILGLDDAMPATVVKANEGQPLEPANAKNLPIAVKA